MYCSHPTSRKLSPLTSKLNHQHTQGSVEEVLGEDVVEVDAVGEAEVGEAVSVGPAGEVIVLDVAVLEAAIVDVDVEVANPARPSNFLTKHCAIKGRSLPTPSTKLST